MKQINGYKFYEPNKEKQVKVITDVGKVVMYNEEEAKQLYMILYAQKYADKVFDETLKELGINKKTAHLLEYIEKDGKKLTYQYTRTGQTVTTPHIIFENILEQNLKKKGITLPYLFTTSSKYKLRLAGNAGALANTYSMYLFESPWKKCEMTQIELANYLKKHKNIKIFKETNMPFDKIICDKKKQY